jgi:hypothetical protein
MMTLFEAYQASDDDAELLHMAYEANEAFTNAMSRFLGVEITSCAACFADALKGEDTQMKGKGNEEAETIV